MRKGREGEARTPKADSGRAARKRGVKFAENDKENFYIYGANVGTSQKKSPLPEWYPRMPLQDITAVLHTFDEGDSSAGARKPFTRSQACLRDAPRKALSERPSKNASRGGSSTSRKKQMTYVQEETYVHEEMTTTENGDSVHVVVDAVHFTFDLTTSVSHTEKAISVEKTEAVSSAADDPPIETEKKDGNGQPGVVQTADQENVVQARSLANDRKQSATLEKAEEIISSNLPNLEIKNQKSQEQKRQKPVSSRSRLSSFR